MFPGVDSSRAALTVEVRCGDEPMTIRSTEGRVTVQPGHAAAPDLVLSGPPEVIIGLLAEQLDATAAKDVGLAVTGDVGVLRRLRPTAPRRAPRARARPEERAT
jgi:hypothetical protein